MEMAIHMHLKMHWLRALARKQELPEAVAVLLRGGRIGGGQRGAGGEVARRKDTNRLRRLAVSTGCRGGGGGNDDSLARELGRGKGDADAVQTRNGRLDLCLIWPNITLTSKHHIEAPRRKAIDEDAIIQKSRIPGSFR
jgi:hypothetical protein